MHYESSYYDSKKDEIIEGLIKSNNEKNELHNYLKKKQKFQVDKQKSEEILKIDSKINQRLKNM